jgi:hypothetical protein
MMQIWAWATGEAWPSSGVKSSATTPHKVTDGTAHFAAVVPPLADVPPSPRSIASLLELQESASAPSTTVAANSRFILLGRRRRRADVKSSREWAVETAWTIPSARGYHREHVPWLKNGSFALSRTPPVVALGMQRR